MTLMPVTRISASVDCSIEGRRLAVDRAAVLACDRPGSSTGSPMTFMIRPRVSGPTGTRDRLAGVDHLLAAGQAVGGRPWRSCGRSISPRCWATSSTSVLAVIVGRAARSGSPADRPSNCTSTTAPITCVTRPAWLLLAADIVHRGSSAGRISVPSLRALRRREMISISSLVICGLAGPVVVERQAVDHVAGVAGGVVHRGHARALLAGRVLEQRGEDLHRDVARQQLGQDRLLVGLELVDRRAPRSIAAASAAAADRDQLLHGRDLADHAT